MLTKKFLTFIWLLTLLLLSGYPVAANSAWNTNEFQGQPYESLNKNESGFHKNMLQPQVVHVNAAQEHLVKLVNPVVCTLCFSNNDLLLLQPPTQTKIILQDVDRCESVSKLLFPYHFFW
jgi:hypothetical protein